MAKQKVGHDPLESLGSHTPPASRSGHAAVTGTKGTPPTSTKQHRSCSNRRPTDNSPDNDQLLWELLSALADPGPGGAGALATDRTVQGAAVAAATAAAAVTGTVAGEGRGLAGSRLSSRHPAGRGASTTAVTAEGIRAGARRSVNAAAAARDGPLVVSVVATLRSGDACYLQEKALLEVRMGGWVTKGRMGSHLTVPAIGVGATSLSSTRLLLCARVRVRRVSFEQHCPVAGTARSFRIRTCTVSPRPPWLPYLHTTEASTICHLVWEADPSSPCRAFLLLSSPSLQ